MIEIIQQREKLALALNNLKIVEKVYPSDANFILVRVKDAKKTYEYLLDKKIITRDRSKVILCDNCLRITIGTPQENERLLNALKSV